MSLSRLLDLMAETNAFTDLSFIFLSIVLEGLPFIVLGTIISGFIDAYLPPGLIDKWLPKNRTVAIFVSGLLGAVLPVCECAIVPVIRRLIKKGLPMSCAITYMLSAPIINPIVVISTLSAFGTDKSKLTLGKQVVPLSENPIFITSSRLAIAFVITVAVGFVVQKMRRETVLQEHVYRGVDDDHDDAANVDFCADGKPPVWGELEQQAGTAGACTAIFRFDHESGTQ